MGDHATIGKLEQGLERVLGTLGDLEPRVVGAMTPQRIGQQLVAWPWSMLGRVRLVRRASGVLFVTEGLSFPFDPGVHGHGRKPLGFELGLELGTEALPGATSEALAGAWPVPALLWTASCYVLDDFHLLDRIEQFGMLTQVLPPDPALAHRVLADGSVGALAGMPLEPTSAFGRASQKLLAEVSGHESRLVLLKALTADECEWARGVDDGTRAMSLAKAFWKRGDAHVTLPQRRSILQSPA